MNRAVQQEDEWKRERRYQLPGLPYNWGLNHRERGAPVNGLTGKKKRPAHPQISRSAYHNLPTESLSKSSSL